LYSAFGNLSLAGLLNGQGRTSFVLKMALLTGAIGFPLGYISIMTFGVLGLIVTVLTANVPSMFMGLRFIRKTYGVSVNWGSSARILVSSAIAGSMTYAVVANLNFSSWVELAFGVAIFIVILVPSAMLTKAINRSDVINLRDMTSGLGIIGGILRSLLNILERLMNTFEL
jgi:hypothetical protein